MLLFLFRVLYDFKQSSILWYRNLFITLNELKLKQISEIECLFICDYMILFFFVNDIIVIYDRQYFKQIDEFEIKLFKIYEMKSMNELKWFLGIRITRNRKLNTMILCQNNYIDKFIVKFNININKKVSNSSLKYITMIKNIEQVTSQSIYVYQQRIKFINFATIITRSNVIFAISKLVEFFINFSNYHINQSNHTLEYLVHTKKYVIVFNDQSTNSKIIFLISSNVSFANDEKTRQSAHEYCFRLFNELIDWKTSKQKTIIINFIETKLLIMFMIANFQNVMKSLFWMYSHEYKMQNSHWMWQSTDDTSFDRFNVQISHQISSREYSSSLISSGDSKRDHYCSMNFYHENFDRRFNQNSVITTSQGVREDDWIENNKVRNLDFEIKGGFRFKTSRLIQKQLY